MIRDYLASDGYYHLINHGIHETPLFRDNIDRNRFLFSLLYFQSAKVALNDVSQQANLFRRKSISEELRCKVVSTRDIELICFALMDNHFHICVKQITDGGISKYMQRISNSYTKYFNTRYDRRGHLFQGPYHLIPVKDNNQLLYLSAYIHKNPVALPGVRGREELYTWSSYPDYVSSNRWGDLLLQGVLLDQFENPGDYLSFVKDSSAKELELESEHFIK